MALRWIKGFAALGGGLLLLAACGGGSESATTQGGAAPASQPPGAQAPAAGAAAGPAGDVPAAAVPAAPASLTYSFGLRSYAFEWAGSAGATHYQFLEDADGPGPGAAVKLADSITDTRYTIQNVPLHLRVNAEYSVRACNSAGCSAPVTMQPDIQGAVGYLKAGNTGENDRFGAAVAVSADGSTLAIGAPGEASHTNYVTADPLDDGAPAAGAVYVFVHGPNGWMQHAYLKGVTGDAGERFGSAVALNGDGTRLAIGAPGWRGIGSVNIWERGADNIWWMGTWLAGTRPGSEFGASVALSRDALRLVVGAPRDNGGTGAAYLWVRYAPSAWNLSWTLHGTAVGDRFGAAVAMAGDGSTFAVGAPGDASATTGVYGTAQQDAGAPGSGAAYAYANYRLQAFIKPGDTSAGGAFGSALALADDGSTLAVGAPGQPIPPLPTSNGSSVLALYTGGAYVFDRAAAGWSQQAVLRGNGDQADPMFGTSVALSADGALLAVGAPDDPLHAFSGSHTGATRLLRRAGPAWSVAARFSPVSLPGATSSSDYMLYGQSVAMAADGKLLLAGAPGDVRAFQGVLTRDTLPLTGVDAFRLLLNAGAAYLY